MIPRTTSGRWLTGAIVIGTLTIVFSLVMGVGNRDREPDLLPEGSPGRAVQDYLLVVQEDGIRAANALLSGETRERCDWDNLSSGRFASRVLLPQCGRGRRNRHH